jgi:hypothetical protein
VSTAWRHEVVWHPGQRRVVSVQDDAHAKESLCVGWACSPWQVHFGLESPTPALAGGREMRLPTTMLGRDLLFQAHCNLQRQTCSNVTGQTLAVRRQRGAHRHPRVSPRLLLCLSLRVCRLWWVRERDPPRRCCLCAQLWISSACPW